MPTLAIYALIALGIFTAGAGSGFKVESWRWSAADLAQQAEIVAERNAAEAKQAAAIRRAGEAEGERPCRVPDHHEGSHEAGGPACVSQRLPR
jgi:hypothetical protein